MAQRSYPFLTFQGGIGREAIEFYTALFGDGEILELATYGASGPGPEGTVLRARFRLAGQEFLASDSFITHEWGFTPAISIWIETESPEELERLFAALSASGQVYMPVGDYGFSRSFAWVGDRFGVSWQLNLA